MFYIELWSLAHPARWNLSETTYRRVICLSDELSAFGAGLTLQTTPRMSQADLESTLRFNTDLIECHDGWIWEFAQKYVCHLARPTSHIYNPAIFTTQEVDTGHCFSSPLPLCMVVLRVQWSVTVHDDATAITERTINSFDRISSVIIAALYIYIVQLFWRWLHT